MQGDPYLGRDDFFYGDYGSNQDIFSFNPQPLQRDTFKQRNDPQELLFRFKLQLMNAYEEETESADENGIIRKKKTIKPRPHTKPRCNPQGVEDIISYLEKIINSHTVQGNIDDLSEYRRRMVFIADDITVHFIAKRKEWGISLEDCDILISGATNLIDLFLTRTLYNEERKGYGEGYKETTHHETRPVEKPNVIQRISSFLLGGKKAGPIRR